MKRIIVMVSLVVGLLAVPVLIAQPAAAVDVFQNCSGAASETAICKSRGEKLFGPGSIWNNALNALIFVIGAAAVLMIIIGAFRYVVSGGDQAGINSAKNTILYAAVGLVLAVMANAIVNFVLVNI